MRFAIICILVITTIAKAIVNYHNYYTIYLTSHTCTNNNSSTQQQIKKIAQKELVTRTKNGKKILLKEIRQQSSSESSESIESISEYVHVTIQNIYKN